MAEWRSLSPTPWRGHEPRTEAMGRVGPAAAVGWSGRALCVGTSRSAAGRFLRCGRFRDRTSGPTRQESKTRRRKLLSGGVPQQADPRGYVFLINRARYRRAHWPTTSVAAPVGESLRQNKFRDQTKRAKVVIDRAITVGSSGLLVRSARVAVLSSTRRCWPSRAGICV